MVRSPRTRAAPSRRSRSLFSRPIPATAPAASQLRSRPWHDGPQDEPEGERPGGQVVDGGPGQVGRREGDGGTGHGQCRQELGEPLPAQGTGRQAGADHDRPSHQGRDDAHRRRTGTEQEGAEPGQQRCQRRLVDVAERRMAAAGDEVELVTVEAVACAHRQLHRHQDGGHRPHAPGQWWRRRSVGTGARVRLRGGRLRWPDDARRHASDRSEIRSRRGRTRRCPRHGPARSGPRGSPWSERDTRWSTRPGRALRSAVGGDDQLRPVVADVAHRGGHGPVDQCARRGRHQQ